MTQQFVKEMETLMKQDKERQAINAMENSPYSLNKNLLKLLGCAYIRVGSYDKAAQAFEAFFQHQHKKHEAAFVWMNIATIMRFQGQPLKGIKIIDRLLRDYPEEPTYWTEKGNCYFTAGKNEEAELCYRKARHHIKNTIETNKAAIYSDIGYYYKEKGDVYAAVFYLELAIHFNPTSKDILLYLGDAYSEANKNQLAKEAYLKAKTYYPEDPHIQDYVRMQMEYLGDD